MSATATGHPNRPSALERPAPIGDSFVLRGDNVVPCTMRHRTVCRDSTGTWRVIRVALRLLGRNTGSSPSAATQIPIAA